MKRVAIICPPLQQSSACQKVQVYVDWVVAGSMEPVRMNYNASRASMREVLRSCDGLIWPGGSVEGPKYTTAQYHDYLSALLFTFKEVVSINKTRVFPLWATCLGFEILYVFETVHNVKFRDVFTHARYHAREGLSTLTFTGDSKLKSWFQEHGVLRKMSTTPSVHHHHTLGFDSSTTQEHLRVVSEDVDHLGLPFVNAFELIRYPVFGVQFHPEQPENAWSAKVSLLFIEFFKSQMGA